MIIFNVLESRIHPLMDLSTVWTCVVDNGVYIGDANGKGILIKGENIKIERVNLKLEIFSVDEEKE